MAIQWLNEQHEPLWSDVVECLTHVKAHPGDRYVSLRVDDEHPLIVYYTDEGWLVTGHGVGDSDYYVLTDPFLGDQHVTVWCGGSDMNRPKKVFVGETIALQAIKYYFDREQRDSTLNWELDSKCW